MRAVVQRVKRAQVTVAGEMVGRVGPGLLVLLGAGQGDGPDDVDYLVGVVRGLKDGRRIEWRVRATVPAHKEYGAGGGDVDTGIPPAIVARMMARGDIAGPGVFVPEQVVPCEKFFSEFARWGVTVDAQMREILAAPEA